MARQAGLPYHERGKRQRVAGESGTETVLDHNAVQPLPTKIAALLFLHSQRGKPPTNARIVA
jgi:hypothetical protein